MMMNCEQALEAISARLDGALSEEENWELETHLASCASCRALLKELTELEEGLETLPVEPPETLAPSVMRAIRAEKAAQAAPAAKKSQRRGPHITAWLIAAAAALALLLGAAGVIDLPGFGEKKHASVSVGDAFSGTHETPEQESELAARIAQERGCAVLAVQGCTDGIEALSGLDYETLDGGAKLYEVPAEVMSGIMDAWQTAYPMQVYAPQEASAADSRNACILLLP